MQVYNRTMSVRVRFAPSPTGHLHVGNVRTALYNWLFARQSGGVFVLRIEDTDLARSESHFEHQLMDDLRWLGLGWDEGVDSGGEFGPYRQTDRLRIYREHADRLLSEGQAYYCFCSAEELEAVRTEQLAAGAQPRYSGKCRALDPVDAGARVESGEAATLRFRVRDGRVGFDDLVFGSISVDCDVIGDFILTRSDGTAQYNFAVVVDDALMKISHVIRGEGHISNTHRQVLLYEALGLSVPQFAHLSTILGQDGSKLSKRHGATSIDQFRAEGYLPQALVNYLALLGWAPREEGREVLSIKELIQEFDLSAVNRSPAVFDAGKLNWLNRSHLKTLSAKELARMALPYFQESNWASANPGPAEIEWFESVVEAVLGYVDKLRDIGEASRLIFDFEPARDLEDPAVLEVLSQPGATEVIGILESLLSARHELDVAGYKEIVQEVKRLTGQKGKALFHPIRVAITGRASGPELDKLVPILETGSRLPLPTVVTGVRDRVRAVMDWLQ